MNIEKTINDLIKYKAEIVKLLSANHWCPYFLIKEKFPNDVLNNNFKNNFCYFYVMNAPMGLNDAQKNEFFRLLSEKENSLKNILKKLYEIPGYGKRHKLFLSFGTKLLHTIDNDLPIYDNNIKDVLNLEGPTYNQQFEIRIKNRISIYNELKDDFKLMLNDSRYNIYLKDLRKKIPEEHNSDNFKWRDNLVSDIKLLDSALWALYTIRKKLENYQKP